MVGLYKESVFVAQVTITLSMMGFSMYQLIKGQDPGIYLPVLSGLIGYWLPAPKLASTQPTAQPEETTASVPPSPVVANTKLLASPIKNPGISNEMISMQDIHKLDNIV